ncbi:MAG: hypothetical protein HC893_12070, partial [Chloroflexaceae bacterium]|nr:hypothetical protein [Chloroflexaceae bacterium]
MNNKRTIRWYQMRRRVVPCLLWLFLVGCNSAAPTAAPAAPAAPTAPTAAP